MITLATRNTFGRAETVEANMSVGSDALPTYRASGSKHGKMTLVVSLDGFAGSVYEAIAS